jgi:hypothetical protein
VFNLEATAMGILILVHGLRKNVLFEQEKTKL